MNENNKIGYYAIIPSTILFNEKIKSNEKLLYAVITVLSNKEGYCYASNGYLARLLNAQPHTISKWVSHLKELGFVCLDIIKNDKGEIIQRRIYPNDTPYTINKTYPYAINRTEGMSQKGQYNNIIDNNINNNNSINQSYKSINKIDVMDETAVYMTLIRENIDYDIMMQDYEWKHRDMYEELYQIICDVVCVPRQEVRIAGEDYPYSLVKSKFLKLKKSHLEYVIGCMERNTTKIVNIKAYLITALYNAPNTISHYYSAEVNHDMCGVRLGNCTGNQ